MIRTQAEVDRLARERALPDWAIDSYLELRDKVADEAFPCTFGTTALQAGEILFTFVEADERDERDALVRELSDVLTEYARFIGGEGIVRASMQPLAVLMPAPASCETNEDYFHHGWGLLRAVHRLDREPWPERIPTDPDTPDWSFCFGGVPLFVNFKTPCHRRRRSRRLASAYLWLMQARDGFDVVAGDTPQGRNARRIIREKLEAYDDVPVYAELAYYGDLRNREWKQYFVPRG